MPYTSSRFQRRIVVALWIVQGLLAALFLFAGGMKLVMPIAALTAQTPLPGLFVRFIGVLEVAGALGLVLPGLVRHLHPSLTPIAAAGLVIVMAGAVGASLTSGPAATALVPVVVGIALACIAYGRWWLASQHAALRPTVLRRAA